MLASNVDVAILGAGPAGCATALRLRQHAPYLSVALVDAPAPEWEPVGGTVPPAMQGLLQGLAVWQAFQDQQHVEAFESISTWGGDTPVSDNFMASPYSRGWHLNRQQFDQMLVAEAEARGVRVYRQTKFTQANRTTRGWDLKLQCDGSKRQLQCSFVVDATGRRAVFAMRHGARRIRDDALIGIHCFFSLEPDAKFDSQLILEPVRDGWWYSTIVSTDRALAVFMTDSDVAKKSGLAVAERFASALRETTFTRDRIEHARPECAPRIVPAGSGCLSHITGDGWIAVGDAASTFDPLSGQGILKATTNGIYAAYAIADVLTGNDHGLRRYGRDILGAYYEYLDTKDQHYATESRWQNSTFWQRRQPPITVDPMAQVFLVRQPATAPVGLRGQVLDELTTSSRYAHDIVSRVKKRSDCRASDHRVILALQSFIQKGVANSV